MRYCVQTAAQQHNVLQPVVNCWGKIPMSWHQTWRAKLFPPHTFPSFPPSQIPQSHPLLVSLSPIREAGGEEQGQALQQVGLIRAQTLKSSSLKFPFLLLPSPRKLHSQGDSECLGLTKRTHRNFRFLMHFQAARKEEWPSHHCLTLHTQRRRFGMGIPGVAALGESFPLWLFSSTFPLLSSICLLCLYFKGHRNSEKAAIKFV